MKFCCLVLPLFSGFLVIPNSQDACKLQNFQKNIIGENVMQVFLKFFSRGGGITQDPDGSMEG